MQQTALTDFARQLLAIHGDNAGAEAAQHKRICADNGDSRTADLWHEVESVLATVGREACH